ncbi:hypothetical protein SRHO_G00067860 [Serrasalmus rhombeus]
MYKNFHLRKGLHQLRFSYPDQRGRQYNYGGTCVQTGQTFLALRTSRSLPASALTSRRYPRFACTLDGHSQGKRLCWDLTRSSSPQHKHPPSPPPPRAGPEAANRRARSSRTPFPRVAAESNSRRTGRSERSGQCARRGRNDEPDRARNGGVKPDRETPEE